MDFRIIQLGFSERFLSLFYRVLIKAVLITLFHIATVQVMTNKTNNSSVLVYISLIN